MVATFGLYVFAWAFFIRRACASLLEQEDQPLWKSVALIVPILNLFLMFDLAKKVEGVQWRSDPARTDGALPWIGISFFAFTILGKLKGPYSALGMLDFVPITLIHQRFSRAQIALLGDAATPTRLHWLEWVALVIGAAFWAFIVYGFSLPASAGPITADERAWFFAVTALAVGGLARFGFTSRRAVTDGLAMHADPSPDRIAPYTG